MTFSGLLKFLLKLFSVHHHSRALRFHQTMCKPLLASMQAIVHCSQLKLDLNIVVGIIKIFIPIDKREMPGQRKTYVVQPSSR